MFLNYHHLRYFWAIAHEGSLTGAAAKLNIAPSALSVQLKLLEENLGHALFKRESRQLRLTEAGRLTLEYADSIFRTGQELLASLQYQTSKQRQVLRVGALATLSRNFQWQFLKPLQRKRNLEIVVRSGNLGHLLVQLGTHSLDVVLSNQAPGRDAHSDFETHLLAEQEIIVVSRPPKDRFRFPDDLRSHPVVLPSVESGIRSGFDVIVAQAGIRPVVAAEVDDMAMLRVLAMRLNAVTVLPRVVVLDELRNRSLVIRCRIPTLKESFYSITPRLKFPNLLVKELIARAVAL